VRDVTLTLGVNDRAQLAEAGRLLNARTVRRWQLEGARSRIRRRPGSTSPRPRSRRDGAPEYAHPAGERRGSGATIGPDTTLEDCEVGENATVRRTTRRWPSSARAPRSARSPTCDPGPTSPRAARSDVRRDEELHDRRGSKVPHLSYIGDTTIGRGVNLGAGAITANYDDIAKHRTEIGDEVHSGSHNVLVAPVRIGDGAKTGAGAVIRKDVPPGASP
jgi:bifunctional UDP-N-acetylglucosamine pyrophosphorylase/glucosamine-1-phosphate N-acetyltransferase